MNSGQIPLAGVIGDPISHSKSPRLHSHWLARYAIAGHYVPLHVRDSNLPHVLKSLPDMGFVGVNVTIPHKQAVLSLAGEVTQTARRIGAANTLTFRPDGSFVADNTDAFGFMQNLRQGAPLWRPSVGPAIVIGAGGAARAVLVALIDAGVPQIILANRSADRATTLAQEFGPTVTPILWQDVEAHFPRAAAVINTSAMGMAGHADLPFSLHGLPPTALVNDIVYTPLETGLLRWAGMRGCTVVDGLGMLLHQAAPGFARWFGQMPEVDQETRSAVLG